ncbi:unnamed protein product [Caenorhabditis brenneri]
MGYLRPFRGGNKAKPDNKAKFDEIKEKVIKLEKDLKANVLDQEKKIVESKTWNLATNFDHKYKSDRVRKSLGSIVTFEKAERRDFPRENGIAETFAEKMDIF